MHPSVIICLCLASLLACCTEVDDIVSSENPGAPVVQIPDASTEEPPETESPEDTPSAKAPEPEAIVEPPPVAEEKTGSDRTLSGPMSGVFKFTDEQGVVHYVDDMEKVPPKYRDKARHPTGGHVSVVESTPIDDVLLRYRINAETYARKNKKRRPRQKRRHDKVYLYTTSWCSVCDKARRYLRHRKVDFIEKDVEHSKNNLIEMLEKSRGKKGVPVIDIYGSVMRGFCRINIDRALDR
jgi:glutaredoxin